MRLQSAAVQKGTLCKPNQQLRSPQGSAREDAEETAKNQTNKSLRTLMQFHPSTGTARCFFIGRVSLCQKGR